MSDVALSTIKVRDDWWTRAWEWIDCWTRAWECLALALNFLVGLITSHEVSNGIWYSYAHSLLSNHIHANPHHWESVNAHTPNPKVYLVGDIVFACLAVHSDASQGLVDKLTYPFIGSCLSLASYMAHLMNLSIVQPKAGRKSMHLIFQPL